MPAESELCQVSSRFAFLVQRARAFTDQGFTLNRAALSPPVQQHVPEDVGKVALAKRGGQLVAEIPEVQLREGRAQPRCDLRHDSAHTVHKLALVSNLAM